MNLPAPTAFVGVNSPAEQQYLSLFQSIGDNLRNRPFQWPQLKRGYTFTTQTGVTKYKLPGDFYRLLDTSQWDVTNKWPLAGPSSDFYMTARQFLAISVTTQKAYRILGPVNYLYNFNDGFYPIITKSAGDFEIDPAGSNNTDQLFLGYLSGNWIWPQAWVANTLYAQNDIRSGDGYVYICNSPGTSSIVRPNVATGKFSDGTAQWTVYNQSYPCSPSNAALSDNDVCLFDDDTMIEGMRWAYREVKVQDFQQLRADWENTIASAFARFESPSRGNQCVGDGDERDFPFCAPGSWSA